MDTLLTNYLLWLIGLSIIIAGVERAFAARSQSVVRRWLWSDLLHLFFNGHFLGLMLYGIAFHLVLPQVDTQLAQLGWQDRVYFNAAHAFGWSLVLQSVIALFVLDFIQWCVHNTLHRSDLLWKIHQVHHSVKDGEMDWIVSSDSRGLNRSFTNRNVSPHHVVWLCAGSSFHAVFGTLIGHLNHANVPWGYGTRLHTQQSQNVLVSSRLRCTCRWSELWHHL